MPRSGLGHSSDGTGGCCAYLALHGTLRAQRCWSGVYRCRLPQCSGASVARHAHRDGCVGRLLGTSKLCAASGSSARHRMWQANSLSAPPYCAAPAPFCMEPGSGATITRSFRDPRGWLESVCAAADKPAGVAVSSIGTVIARRSPRNFWIAWHGFAAAAPLLQAFLGFWQNAPVERNTCLNRIIVRSTCVSQGYDFWHGPRPFEATFWAGGPPFYCASRSLGDRRWVSIK